MTFSFILNVIALVATVTTAWETSAKPSAKQTNTNEDALFTPGAYPMLGDIPLLNRKVFKASRAITAEHPYLASIRRNTSHYLTGAVLTQNLVLTVAHPLFHVPSYELGVVVGETFSDRGTSILTVLIVIIHQHFDPWTLQHDLALLRLFEYFHHKLNLKPIQLVQGHWEQMEGHTAFVTGWGRCDFSPVDLCFPRSSVYYPNEIQDPMLRSISFPLTIDSPFCNEYNTQNTPIHDGMMCLGVARATDPAAACLAVPGAPVVVRGKLLGVQSWGFGCGYTNDLPLVYTDLKKYKNWLESNLASLANISRHEVLQLYEATKSFVLRDVMYTTRKYHPIGGKHKHQELTMLPLPVDSKLAMLKGKVYDLRDFLGKRYHEEKKEMYRLLRLKIQDRIMLLSNTTVMAEVDSDLSTASTLSDSELDSDYYQEMATNAVN